MRIKAWIVGALIGVLLAFSVGPRVVEAQAPARIYGTTSGNPIALLATAGGLLRVSVDGGTFTTPFLGPDGTCGLPTYAYSSDATTGTLYVATNNLAFSAGGTCRAMVTAADGFRLKSDYKIGFTSGTVNGTNMDTPLTREGAGYLLQQNATTAQRWSVANTWTSLTNKEEFSVDWQTQANFALIGTRTAATGTGRYAGFVAQTSSGGAQYAGMFANRVVGLAPNASFVSYSVLGIFSAAGGLDATSNTSANFTAIGYGQSTATSGTIAAVGVFPTYNQSSGTAANTDLLINRTQTAVGSGAQLLIDAQVSTVSKFSVDNTGGVTSAAGMTASLFNIGSTYRIGGVVVDNATAPTIASGGCTSPAVTHNSGTAAFLLTIGSSCTGVKSLTLTMPASAHFWACQANNNTSDAQQASNYVISRATTTTAVVLTSYDRITGVTEDFTAADTYLVSCRAE